MNRPPINQSPIVRFLGEDAGRGGPFALLGLPHAFDSAEAIGRAQSRRLRQIECHPHRATPDADEVRLAVHSAATQLQDPALREQLAQRWPEGTPIDIPKAWQPRRAMQRLTPAFIRRARMVVGSSGGWNPVARRRLAHLARLNRVSALEVVHAIGAGTTTKRAEPGSGALLPTTMPSGPGNGSGWIGAYALLGLLICALFVTIAIDPVRYVDDLSPRASASPGPVVESISDGMQGGVLSAREERERLTHYTAIAHELDRLVARAQVEAEPSIERFRVIYPLFVEQWISFPDEALQRAVINIAEFMVRIEQQGIPPEDLPSVLAVPAIEPDRRMISAATVDVVLASPELSGDARRQLRALRERLDPAPIVPRSRVVGVIADIASDQARNQEDDDTQWWTRWLNGTIRATSGDDRARTRLLIEALGSRLSDPDNPGRDWLSTASLLATGLQWRAESTERYWLLSQFNDPQVSTVRIAMLTEALVAGSAAEGIDARMVLARDANDPARQVLAQRYRDVWFPQSGSADTGDGSEGTADELLRELRLAINSVQLTSDEIRTIDTILDLTRLTTAAALRAQGHDAISQELLLNPPQIQSPDPIEQFRSLSTDTQDIAWAQRAVNCESAAELRPLLDELVGSDQIGVNSAHALVYLAVLRPESELRDLASAQLLRGRDQVSVLIAVDYALSQSRISSRLDELVRSVLETRLPDRNDPAWYTAARRALLARIGHTLGSATHPHLAALPGALSDVLSLRLTEIQQSQFGNEPTPGRIMDIINMSDRLVLESRLRENPASEPELRSLDARAMIRSTRAGTPMERYLAAQYNAFDLHAFDIDTRLPGATRMLAELRIRLTQRLDGADSILNQIVLVERAIAELWVLEIERGGAR